MSKTDSDIKAVQEAKAAAARIKQTAHVLEERHKVLSKERDVLMHAVASANEVLTNMRRLVDEKGAEFIKDFGSTFVRHLSGYTELRGPGDSRERVIRPHIPHLPDGYLGRFDALCAVLPDLLKDRLEQVIRGSGAAFGLPKEARAAKVAELDASIAQVEALHTELVDGAANVGIEIPLLPAVRTRREKEALRLRRERELEAERARGVYVPSGASIVTETVTP